MTRALHVLPSGAARGAQVYAIALARALSTPQAPHRVATLFSQDGPELAGVDVASRIPTSRLRRAWADPRAVALLRRVTAAERPDVVVCHGLETLKYAGLLRRRHRPGLVALAIGTGTAEARRGVRGVAYRRLVRRADVLAGVSNAVCEMLARTYSTPAVLLRNGRDPDAYPVHTTSATGAPTAIFVGQLDEGKRPELFVSAMRSLRHQGIAVRPIMIGDGPRRTEIASLARSVGIELLGTRYDVPAQLAAADLLVFTSKPPEGMPGVLIEAAFAGIPAVSTDVPGARDVIDDGVTGSVVPVDDPDELFAAVQHFMVDSDLRCRAGAAARQRALATFSLNATLDDWQRVLSHAAGAARRR